MNKAKLKSYAPQARKDFIAAVTARANLLGLSDKAGKLEVVASLPQGDVTVIAGQAWPVKVHSQRDQLVTRMQRDGFAQTMEAVAYTWFNRFAALRYMELHDYLGHGHRALSSTAGTLPDILTHAADLAQSSELPGLKAVLVTEMKLAGNRDSELYRMLLVAQCNALSAAMPFLFERIDDETELLLPDNLLRTDSVITKLVSAIDEDDWKEVEIIGWLYQFYISEKKDDVIGKVVKSEDIPAATQLFTPNWIVQYLVQNSVGRLWLMANPASTLKAQWPYYIEPAQQTLEVQVQLDALIQTRMDEDGGSLNPESITCLDPACGSGHILVVAYDVLKAIYLERGYQPRAIPRLILEKNLYGLDIDDRAAQMAGFALLMKARADDRRLFNEPIKLNVLALQESKGLDADVLSRALQTVAGQASPESAVNASASGFGDDDLFPGTRPQIILGESSSLDTAYDLLRPAIAELIATFAHAKTFGSLIQIAPGLNARWPAMVVRLQLALQNGDMYAKAAVQDLWPLVAQARVLGMQFDAVVANPPYMGAKAFTPELKDWLKSAYKGNDKDLFSAFIARMLIFTRRHGYSGVMTSFVWMFIASFEQLRKSIVFDHTITSLVQLHYDAFADAKAHVCTFVLQNEKINSYKSAYVRLADFSGVENQGPKTLEAIRNPNCDWFFETSQDEFSKIPGSPIAYWIRNAQPFDGPRISDEFTSGGRTKTHGNEQYLRFWWEVQILNEAWAPYATGGDFRKYSGNFLQVVNWSDAARAVYDSFGGLYPEKFWYKEGITWGKITSSRVSFRLKPNAAHYDSGAGAIFSRDFVCDRVLLGFLNSPIVNLYLKAMNPTVNTTVNDVLALPLPKQSTFPSVDVSVGRFVARCQSDWDAYERSCEFKRLPILPTCFEESSTIESSYNNWVAKNCEDITEMKRLEEENNRLFIDAYVLTEELTHTVPIEQITLTVNPAYRYSANLAEDELWSRFRKDTHEEVISYAIGCMMGRYSLDAPGLIYAHAGSVGFEPNFYSKFSADVDGILPLTDELWFEDDAASRIREFLRAVWGPDTLKENLVWLAESLGTKASETPDETIRRYLADKFYKDHLQTYKKRPIYWLFSSGKQGAFQGLVYLHRYHEGTLARLRAEYVVPLTSKIQSRIDMLQKDAAAHSSTAARSKLAKEVEKLKKKHVELLAYDEQLRHYADMRISLDLDDGVKVNYGKFGDLLAEVKAVTGGAGDD